MADDLHPFTAKVVEEAEDGEGPRQLLERLFARYGSHRPSTLAATVLEALEATGHELESWADPDGRDLQRRWFRWRTAQQWDAAPVHLAAKVAEEAGEVLGATLKLSQHGRAGTHPDHTVDHLRMEIGQLVGTVFCLAEHFGINPSLAAADALADAEARFPVDGEQDG